VTISTELKNRGLVEGYIAKLLLQKIYRQELELLSNLAKSGSASGPLNRSSQNWRIL
jgi:hypothetical protein